MCWNAKRSKANVVQGRKSDVTRLRLVAEPRADAQRSASDEPPHPSDHTQERTHWVHRQHYASVLDLSAAPSTLQGMTKEKQWRDYVTKGATALEPLSLRSTNQYHTMSATGRGEEDLLRVDLPGG